jgi:hypothetical protein
VADERSALDAMDDIGLEGALRDLSTALAYPSAGIAATDLATRVRQRIAAAPPAPRRGLTGWLAGRPLRRSLVVAIAVLLALAAVAGAVGLGLPGIRILFGGPTPPPTTSPSTSGASPGTLGQTLGLGTRVSIDDAERLSGLELILPTDPELGPPAGAYVLANRVALVWPESTGLPADPSSGVGLLISQFRGEVTEGIYDKYLQSDARLTQVTVNGNRGFWISGPPHFFAYVDPSGRVVEDTRRVVGDTLIWADGDVTYRLEARIGMEDAITLAESLR